MTSAQRRHYNRPQQSRHIYKISRVPATPLCTVRFGHILQPTVVDTGADLSVIRSDLYKKLPRRQIISVEKPDYPDCVSATGDPLKVFCTARIKLNIGASEFEHRFTIVDHLRKRMLLGSDFLSLNRAKINFGERTLTLREGVTIPLGVKSKREERRDCLPLVWYSNKKRRAPAYDQPNHDYRSWRWKNRIMNPRGRNEQKEKKQQRVHNERRDKEQKEQRQHQSAVIKGPDAVARRPLNTSSKGRQNNKEQSRAVGESHAMTPLHDETTISRLEGRGEGDLPELVESEDEEDPSELQCLDSQEPDIVIGGAKPDIGSSDPATRKQILQFLKQQEHMFAASDLELGTTHLMEFGIDTEGHVPIRQRPYRVAWTQKKIIDEHLDTMLKAGVIVPSCSAWASPILLVPKKPDPASKEVTYRFCVDYRKLNNATKKNAAPLPNIADVLESMEGSRVFSCLDLRQGYWQIPLKEEDQEKTAFITHKGLFQFTKVAFGLCNAPSAFVQLMNAALGNAQYKHVLAYLDDVVIHSKDLKSHMEHLQDVFNRLERAGLKLKMSKCQFLKPEVQFLGHVISSKGIHVSPEKVKAIAELSPPTTPRGVRGFIGMCSYYRKFIPNFAEIARCLTQLTKKKVKFTWTDECQRAFDALKKGLTTAPVLAFPSPDRPFIVYTDSSAFAVGAVLAQMDEEGSNEHVIQYLSQQLNETQARWSASERECYAIVFALNRLRPYLLGTRFTLYTDHKPLSSLFVSSMKNARIQRWSAILSEYDMDIKHRPGSVMKADFLSRLPAKDTPETTKDAVEEDRYLPEIQELTQLQCTLCGSQCMQNGNVATCYTFLAAPDGSGSLCERCHRGSPSDIYEEEENETVRHTPEASNQDLQSKKTK